MGFPLSGWWSGLWILKALWRAVQLFCCAAVLWEILLEFYLQAAPVAQREASSVRSNKWNQYHAELFRHIKNGAGATSHGAAEGGGGQQRGENRVANRCDAWAFKCSGIDLHVNKVSVKPDSSSATLQMCFSVSLINHRDQEMKETNTSSKADSDYVWVFSMSSIIYLFWKCMTSSRTVTALSVIITARQWIKRRKQSHKYCRWSQSQDQMQQRKKSGCL